MKKTKTHFLKLVIVILALTSVTLADNKKKTRYCKFAQLFGADGTDIPRKYETPAFCTNIKKTCCSDKDFLQLQNWWENSFDKISVVEQRLIEMKTLLGRFRRLQNYADEAHIRVKRIKQHKKDGQPACVSPAHVLGKVFSLGLIKTAVKSYEDSSEKCWNHTKTLMNGLMCAVCDADQQDMLVSDKKKVIISPAQCQKFTTHCLDHLKSLWALTHYMSFMNMISKCSEDAKFKGDHDEVMLSTFELRAINSCMHAKNLDDCAQVCRSQMSFSAKVKFEHNAIEKVMGFLRNIDREFGILAKKKRIANDKKKAQEKKGKAKQKTEKELRVLAEEQKKYNRMMEEEEKTLKIVMGFFNKNQRVLPDKKETTEQEKNKYRTAQIDELGVLVKEKGLNLSKYTDKDVDKFENMNLELIFGMTRIVGVSVIGLLFFAWW